MRNDNGMITGIMVVIFVIGIMIGLIAFHTVVSERGLVKSITISEKYEYYVITADYEMFVFNNMEMWVKVHIGDKYVIKYDITLDGYKHITSLDKI